MATFTKRPLPIAEASRRIEEATGIKRGLTQTRKFLKKSRPEMEMHGGDPAASEENDRGTRRHAGRIPRQKTGTAIGFGAMWQRPPLLCRCVALRPGSVFGLSVVLVSPVYSRRFGPHER